MKGVTKAARKSSGLTRTCAKCKFNWGMLNGDICTACGRAFREGFHKGSEWTQKQLKNNEEK